MQSYLKQGGLTLDRVWSYGGDSDAYITSKVTAAKNAGMTCLFMLGETNELAWLEHVVQLTEPMGCHIFEFGNEPDNGGSLQGTIANYTRQWIAAIPVLRSLPGCETKGAPDVNKCDFGGPALTWSASNNTNTSSYPDDMSYFLGTAKAAKVLPDFVTYHDYPCQKATTMSQCVSMTPADFQWNYNTVITDERAQLGHTIPTGMTEYNFDAGDGNSLQLGGRQHVHVPVDPDGHRQPRLAPHRLRQPVHVAQLTRATATSTCSPDAAPYGPKPQFYAMVAEVEKYGGSSTLRHPQPVALVVLTRLVEYSADESFARQMMRLNGSTFPLDWGRRVGSVGVFTLTERPEGRARRGKQEPL